MTGLFSPSDADLERWARILAKAFAQELTAGLEAAVGRVFAKNEITIHRHSESVTMEKKKF